MGVTPPISPTLTYLPRRGPPPNLEADSRKNESGFKRPKKFPLLSAKDYIGNVWKWRRHVCTRRLRK